MVIYRQVMAQRQHGSSPSVILRALAVSLTCLRDLESEEKWIWPKGKVELFHWQEDEDDKDDDNDDDDDELMGRKVKEGLCVLAAL